MILTQEIRNSVTKLGLRDNVIEKDYVIGWLLWGISTVPELANGWAFKGGTAIKKCYIETWRFSEDLDFTVLPGGPVEPKTIKPLLSQVLERVHNESGIDFSIEPFILKHADRHLYTEGRIYYRGPLHARKPARVKIDISGSEVIVQPTVLQNISHFYSDSFPRPAVVRCYSIAEIFAEKLRAMAQRGRPRDLYDIVLLFKFLDKKNLKPQVVNFILAKKCTQKNILVPTLKSIQSAETKSELIHEWENMLSHQVQELHSFEYFWDKLPEVFGWLESS